MSDITEVLISFDTTGSMFPCLAEVRKSIKELVDQLFSSFGKIHIGIFAQGDYAKFGGKYLLKKLELTSDKPKLVDFIQNVEPCGNQDYPEPYETVLHDTRFINWEKDANKILIMFADAYPHPASENPDGYDWKKEAEELKKAGIRVYAVQCMYNGSNREYEFFESVATITSGYHLFLDQFSAGIDALTAICLQQMDNDNTRVEAYEKELKAKFGTLTTSMQNFFDVMLKRTTSAEVAATYATRYSGISSSSRSSGKSGGKALAPLATADPTKLLPCPPSKYQVMTVDEDKIPQFKFIEKNGLVFHSGDSFYEFTKPESISAGKEIVLMERKTGNLFEGVAARHMIGLKDGVNETKVSPVALSDFRVFIQSKSKTRGLVKGTGFLYKVDPNA